MELRRCVISSWAFPWLSPHILSKDPLIGLDAVGLPSEVVKMITFEEQVTDININKLQEVVDQ
jgi:DNA-directed RNA polymerase-5 subunit 1